MVFRVLIFNSINKFYGGPVIINNIKKIILLLFIFEIYRI
jgi:hypothetical protein